MTASPLRIGLAYLLIGLAPMAFAIRGVRDTRVISPTSMTHVDGASYNASIPPSLFTPVLVAASDAPLHEQRSASRLFEDGRELGPAHALHIGIAAVGKGRFSHWTTTVYFSASDNSDPRTNGRVYRLERVARLPTMVTVAWALTFIFAAATSTFLWIPGGPRRTWWLPHLLPRILAVASLVAVAVMLIAGPGPARVWALVTWLGVGFGASFFAGVSMRRVSSARFLRALAAGRDALAAAWRSGGSASPLRVGLVYLFIALAPLAFGIRGVIEPHVISPASLTHVDGASYVTSIPPSPFAPVLVAASDGPGHEQRSVSRLFEDQRELGPAHALHVDITAKGDGRFSHWARAVYVSASNSSDPRTNGRIYTLETVARLPMMVTVGWLLTFILAAVMSPRFWEPAGRARAWWRPRLWPPALVAASVVAIAVMCLANSGSVRVSALASWLAVGFAAAFFAGASVRRVLSAGLASAAIEEIPALIVAWKSVDSVATSLEQRIFDAPGWKGFAVRTVSLAAPVAIFVAILITAWPEWLLAQAYSGGGLLILAAAAGLWLAHARRGWLATLLSLTVTLGLFGLALAALWQDVTFHYNAIAGLLPFSDAKDYFYEANRLLDGHPLTWSARRPLFTAFLAVLLAVTGSLSAALAVMVGLNAIGTFLLAREIRLSFGSVAATVTTLVLFSFYRHDGGTGVVLSENLGFLLGTAAFSGLLRGSRLQDARSYLSGAGLLTAALMARAGAFFVLPALVFAALLCLRQKGGRRILNMRAASTTAALIAIAAGTLLFWGKALSDPAAGKTAFSNYSQSLYGLVVGGKGWTQVRIDHPTAQEGAEIYALAYAAFRARPSGLLEGLAKMAKAYVVPSEPYHMFAFIQDGPRTRWLQRICYALVIVGLGGCVWRWRDPVHALVLAIAVGHFASIPLVPPIDAGLRVYAATTPILALLIAAGIAVPRQLLARWWHRGAKTIAPAHVDTSVTSRVSELASLSLVALIVGMSSTLYALSKPTISLRRACPNGGESLLVRIDDDAMVRIQDDRARRAISPTVVRQNEAQFSVGLLDLKAEAHNLRAGMSLAFAYDLLDGRQVWLAADSGRLPARTGLLQICGHDAGDPMARYYGMIYVDEASVLAIH